MVGQSAFTKVVDLVKSAESEFAVYISYVDVFDGNLLDTRYERAPGVPAYSFREKTRLDCDGEVTLVTNEFCVRSKKPTRQLEQFIVGANMFVEKVPIK